MMYASELWLAKLTEARKLLNESVGAHVCVGTLVDGDDIADALLFVSARFQIYVGACVGFWMISIEWRRVQLR